MVRPELQCFVVLFFRSRFNQNSMISPLAIFFLFRLKKLTFNLSTEQKLLMCNDKTNKIGVPELH